MNDEIKAAIIKHLGKNDGLAFINLLENFGVKEISEYYGLVTFPLRFIKNVDDFQHQLHLLSKSDRTLLVEIHTDKIWINIEDPQVVARKRAVYSETLLYSETIGMYPRIYEAPVEMLDPMMYLAPYVLAILNAVNVTANVHKPSSDIELQPQKSSTTTPLSSSSSSSSETTISNNADRNKPQDHKLKFNMPERLPIITDKLHISGSPLHSASHRRDDKNTRLIKTQFEAMLGGSIQLTSFTNIWHQVDCHNISERNEKQFIKRLTQLGLRVELSYPTTDKASIEICGLSLEAISDKLSDTENNFSLR